MTDMKFPEQFEDWLNKSMAQDVPRNQRIHGLEKSGPV